MKKLPRGLYGFRVEDVNRAFAELDHFHQLEIDNLQQKVRAAQARRNGLAEALSALRDTEAIAQVPLHVLFGVTRLSTWRENSGWTDIEVADDAAANPETGDASATVANATMTTDLAFATAFMPEMDMPDTEPATVPEWEADSTTLLDLEPAAPELAIPEQAVPELAVPELAVPEQAEREAAESDPAVRKPAEAEPVPASITEPAEEPSEAAGLDSELKSELAASPETVHEDAPVTGPALESDIETAEQTVPEPVQQSSLETAEAREAEHQMIVETATAREAEHQSIVETAAAREAEHQSIVEAAAAREAEQPIAPAAPATGEIANFAKTSGKVVQFRRRNENAGTNYDASGFWGDTDRFVHHQVFAATSVFAPGEREYAKPSVAKERRRVQPASGFFNYAIMIEQPEEPAVAATSTVTRPATLKPAGTTAVMSRERAEQTSAMPQQAIEPTVAVEAQTSVEAVPVSSGSQAVSAELAKLREKYITGKIAGADLFDEQGVRIIAKHEPITPEVIDRAGQAGKLAELIVQMTVPGLEVE